MSMLVAFEAAARHCSFTLAGVELSLTQSAVTRQVQGLEALLEVQLFRREGRKIELTPAGALYQHELAAALGRIRSATLQTIAHNSESATLNLAVLPTFGSKWLLPRLHDFYARHPSCVVHVHSRIIDLDQAPVLNDMHALICAGQGHWPGYISHPLVAEKMVLIASARALPGYADMAPADVLQHVLLGVVSRPHVWSEWFDHYGLDRHGMRMGPSFEFTAHLIQAVAAGIGVALVPRILVQDEIRSGALVTLFEPMDSGRTYYLAYASRYQHWPSLLALRDWLLAQPFPDAITQQP